MTRIISRAELARWAGLNKSNAVRACQGKLADAVVAHGVDAEHPLVRAWLAVRGVDKLPHLAGSPDAAPSSNAKPKKKPKTVKTRAAVPPQVETNTPDPFDLEHLENLTVREIVMRFGSVDGFKRFVDSLKSISEFKYKELRAKQQRGSLIERTKVAGIVFPLIDVAFSRLVSDVPDSVSKLVMARVQSGGPETLIDIQKMIRDANSRVMKNVKQSVIQLELLQDAN